MTWRASQLEGNGTGTRPGTADCLLTSVNYLPLVPKLPIKALTPDWGSCPRGCSCHFHHRVAQ